jgi:putative ABC transport system substrate-binding protein
MKRLLSIAAMLLLAVSLASAQDPAYRISVSQFVEHPALDSVLKGFQDDLAENGIQVDYSIHNAQANMGTASQIATQIMGERPDLILAIATPSAQTCAQALKKAPQMQNTPMLFSAITDPVAAGLVDDLQHPDANITGVSDMLPLEQHMEMVRDFLPEMKSLGVMYNSGEANSKSSVDYLKRVGAAMDFEVVEATVSRTSDVYQAAKSLVGKVDAVFVPTDNTVVEALESAIRVCTQSKMPLFAADVDSVRRGAIAAMGFDYYQHGRQTGAMARRVLEGARIGDTPVETQQTLQLHVNPDAARKMGLAVPEAIVARADKVY